MSAQGKVVVNLATGIEENSERAMLAFFVTESALAQGKQVLMFLSLEAIRIALPDHVKGIIPCEGCPSLDKLYRQVTRAGAEIYVCPVCMHARGIEDDDL